MSAVLLLVTGVFAMAEGTSTSTSDVAPSAASSTVNNTLTVNPSTNASLKIIAKPVKLSPQQQNAAQKTGYKFVAYNCTAVNVGTTSKNAAYNTWTLRDAQGHVYEAASGVNVTGTEWQSITKGMWWNPSGDFEPGRILNGIVVFEVPQNVQQFKSLTYHSGTDKIVTNL